MLWSIASEIRLQSLPSKRFAVLERWWLEQCVKSDGTPLVQGLNVTGFSCSEEAAVSYTVPWVIENKFKEQGGNYSNGGDWTSHIQTAGNLLTGQNPQSSEALGRRSHRSLLHGSTNKFRIPSQHRLVHTLKQK